VIRRALRRRARTESGYTLVELIIALTLLATVTGSLVAAFITTNNANANTSERIHESTDAQIIAGFWTADAQAAGGVDPALGTTDPGLGVSKTDDGGCGLGGGLLVSRFKWREWQSRDSATTLDTYTTRVANYVYRASTNVLERRTCANGTSTGVLTLATRVASAPTVQCDGSTTCAALPGTVSITITETNQPSTGPQYVFTLTATVRPNDQTAPGAGNAAGSPLLALGSGTCSSGTTGLSVSGNTTVVVNGQAAINASDIGSCTAITANGSIQYTADGTSLVPGGTCSGNRCPPTTTDSTRIGDPFASLPVPSFSCSGSGNPPTVGGHLQPGTYRSAVTLSGIMDAGTYVFCNSVTWGTVTGNGVFMYFTGSSSISMGGNVDVDIKAPASGTYAGMLIWNATTNAININGNGSLANYNGAVYSPNADVNVAGTSSTYIGMIVAKRIFFSGNHTTDITNGQLTPGAPSLTTTTGTTLRTVDLSWTAPGYTGATGSPITGYEYRVDSGGGYGSWTTVPGGLVTSMTHTCGTSDTVPTTCTYQVRAVNAQGGGSASNAASAASAVDDTPPVVTVTAPASGATVGASTTFSGTAGNLSGDGTAISVQLYSGAGCAAGSEIGAPLTTNRAGTTWSVASPVMTAGAKSVCASQSDTAGNTGRSAARGFTVDTTGPTPTTLFVQNGGTLGRVDKGDTVAVTFSEPVNPASVCAGWNGTSSRSSVTVTITNNDPTTGGNDSLTVTDASCPTFNFGKINLGSASWVTATTSYSGNGNNASTAVFNAALTTLTVKLGNGTAGPTGVAATTMTYTPAPAIADAFGNTATGTISPTNQRF
jgi:type II secretory pathway component PulJ